jgi:opacity protein-like surface antigen
MKCMLLGAALAVLAMTAAGPASATMCTNSCDHNYSICNAENGGNGQQTCMPKWMQCKKACEAPAKAPIKVSNTSRPHR